MRVHALICGSFVGLLAFVPTLVMAQDSFRPVVQKDVSNTLPAHAVIDEIRMVGLHRVAAETAKSHLSLRSGEEFDAARLAVDLRALSRLGWFEDVSVEAQRTSDHLSELPHFRLEFHFIEYPILIAAEFGGSELLSSQQIRKLLEEKGLAPELEMPADPVKLHRIASAIESELAGLGHPEARVAVEQQIQPGQAAKAFFHVHDGPHLPVVNVSFSGDPELPSAVLRRQMHEIAPDAWLSGFRNKNAFTPQKSEQDRLSLLSYLQNRGFPQARIGAPQVAVVDGFSARTLPWFRRRPETGLKVVLPVEAGTFYNFGFTKVSTALREQLVSGKTREPMFGDVRPGHPFSQRDVEALQRRWEIKLYRKTQRRKTDARYRLRAIPTFDASTHLASMKFDFDPQPPYVVRRIDFRGNQRFPDRYLRRRIGLNEGQALDEYALQAGLARLARTGYFRPFKKEDIHIATHETERTADITMLIHEKGKQRVTFSGGREQFGSTLGIAYTVFNLLGMDEFLSTQLDGGPEMLQLAMGLAKEGFLGSRGTLALSVFDTFLRPRFASSVQAPFLRSETKGANVGWTYAASDADAAGINFGVSRSSSECVVNPAAGSTATQPTDLRSDSSSHSIGIGWMRYGGPQKIQLTDSVSGGWLGGSENLLKSKAEYGQIFSDQVFDRHNSWAFRTTVSGVGSYKGDMPLYARFFSGDDLVRGLRPGELGPYETFSSVSSSGVTSYSAVPAGADLLAAANLEYRFPVHHLEGAAFFDTGSGLLLPNWLGRTRPSLIDSTNGVVHTSTGLEVRYTLPGVGVPLRVNYSFNLLRLNRAIFMPDGSVFRLHNRLGAVGWGLGPLF